MGEGPLKGLRVLELGGIGPAPFAAMFLADLGAEVIRVDRPAGTDVLPGDQRFDLTNRGKRSVVIDLKRPQGRQTVLKLAERADVLLEGFRPGVTERLGLGPEDCWKHNPRLVYGRMTGWGQDGPLAQTAGHDVGYISLTGVLHAIGPGDGAPQIPLNLVGDYGGGALYLVIGVLAALREAEGTGLGQVVDAAIVDGTAHLATLIYGMLAAGSWRDEREANLLDGGAPFYSVYRTADGQYMAVGPIEPQFYAEFIRRLGLDEADLAAQHDTVRWPELRKRVAEVFQTRTRDEWVAIFDGTDACVAPVLSLREAFSHPHLVARGTFVAPDGVWQPAPAPRFSRTPGAIRQPPALPGTHTREVLGEWGVDDVEALLADGTAVQRDTAVDQ